MKATKSHAVKNCESTASKINQPLHENAEAGLYLVLPKLFECGNPEI